MLISVFSKGQSLNSQFEYTEKAHLSTVIVAGGCFWCVEYDFEKVNGVFDAIVGYSGGEGENPTYEEVSQQKGKGIGHIEVTYIVYDKNIVSFYEVIDFFFKHIDPTDGEGQFCDRGPQYAPAVFYSNEEEKNIIKNYIIDLNNKKVLPSEVKVQVIKRQSFYKAEEYHQDYGRKNPLRYNFYRLTCGRDNKVRKIWGTK